MASACKQAARDAELYSRSEKELAAKELRIAALEHDLACRTGQVPLDNCKLSVPERYVINSYEAKELLEEPNSPNGSQADQVQRRAALGNKVNKK